MPGRNPDELIESDDEGDYDDLDDACQICDGSGWILDCCDDMCRGVGYCIHGDGMRICSCNTSCDPPPNAPADWRWKPR